jgi:hypothetical protein
MEYSPLNISCYGDGYLAGFCSWWVAKPAWDEKGWIALAWARLRWSGVGWVVLGHVGWGGCQYASIPPSQDQLGL